MADSPSDPNAWQLEQRQGLGQDAFSPPDLWTTSETQTFEVLPLLQKYSKASLALGEPGYIAIGPNNAVPTDRRAGIAVRPGKLARGIPELKMTLAYSANT